MKRKLLVLSLALILAFSCTGCAESAQLNLTKEEEQQIASYSADLLLKYDRNHQSNIVDTSYQRELEARIEAQKEAAREELENPSDDSDTADTSKDNGSTGGSGSSMLYPPEGEQNLAAALGQPDFNISYTGYEVCQSYPDDDSEVFAMDATAGKQLLVFHFDIENITSEDRECVLIDKDAFYRIIVNDSERLNALTTILMNDLATVDEAIVAGGHYDSVVVLETEPGYEQQIESLSLLAKYGEDSQSVIPLQ